MYGMYIYCRYTYLRRIGTAECIYIKYWPYYGNGYIPNFRKRRIIGECYPENCVFNVDDNTIYMVYYVYEDVVTQKGHPCHVYLHFPMPQSRRNTDILP